MDVTLGLGDTGEPEALRGELVGGNYFTTLRAATALGRPLVPDDDRVEGARAVAVISHRLWTRRFGASPDAVGRTIRLNGAPFEVVGVMPPAFRGSFPAMPADVWVPLSMHDALRHTGLSRERRGWGWLWMTGRIGPGVSLAQARARMDAIARGLAAEYPRVDDGFGAALYPAATLPEETREGAARLLGFAMAVVGLALLVACANIAGVMQARLAARRVELAIRQSLGASRLRLVRQWLTESLVLAALGGGAGLVLTRWTFGVLEAALPPESQFGGVAPALALDGRVVAFSSALIVFTAILFGLWPAWRAGREALAAAIGEGSTRLAGGRRQARARRVLVVLQVAVCLVLLVVSGLLLRSVRRAAAFDVGFDTRHLALMSIDLKRFGYPPDRVRTFYDDLRSRLRALPGVDGVTTGFVVPLGYDRERITFRVDGATPPGDPDGFHFDYNLVGPRYFRTLGIPIVEGRGFDERDDAPGAAPVAVVNETLARRLWPGGSAIGHTHGADRRRACGRIVGVARDITYYTLGEDPRPYVYAPAAQLGAGALTVHVRTAGDPARLLPALRAQAVALDREPHARRHHLRRVPERAALPEPRDGDARRRVRPARARARRDWDLRHPRLERRRAHARDRGAHGVRRVAGARVRRGGRPGGRARGRRSRARAGRGGRRERRAREPARGRPPHRPPHLCARRRVPARRGGRRRLPSRAPRRARRSRRRAAESRVRGAVEKRLVAPLTEAHEAHDDRQPIAVAWGSSMNPSAA